MPEDPFNSVRKKVDAIFTELAGERGRTLHAGHFSESIATAISAALRNSEANEQGNLKTDEIAFHLTDWNSDAAFIVALHLFPERFTPEEIDAAVGLLLVHVPHHVIAAARLAGYPVEDIFAEGDEDLE